MKRYLLLYFRVELCEDKSFLFNHRLFRLLSVRDHIHGDHVSIFTAAAD